MLFLDGVYVDDGAGHFGFHANKAPTPEQLTEVLHTISQRVAGFLERRGLLERDEENSYITLDGLDGLDEDPMQELHSHSVTYRIAIGRQRGRKVFTLQTIPPRQELPPGSERLAKLTGFSLHAGVAAKAHQRDKVERLCRYIARPAVSEKRLSLTATGKVRYELKSPYRNGTTHVIFEPVDFMYRRYGMPRAQGCAGAAIARLAALVPKPRVNLTRFHGVFAPNSKHRIHITPAKRGRGRKALEQQLWDEKTPAERHVSMTWMEPHDERQAPSGRGAGSRALVQF
jgi:hypothetical protein